MTCENSANINFEFRDNDENTYLKIRPRSMQFDRTRGKFDYCEAEFSDEVANHLRPALENDDSVLRHPLPVYIFIDGEAIYRLLWVPDGVRFVEDGVHVEFHDPQKVLTEGTVDWKRESVTLEEAYDYVFNQRDKSGPNFFNGIKYTVPEEAYDELRTTRTDGPLWLTGDDRETEDLLQEEAYEEEILGFSESKQIAKLEEENVYNIIKGHYAIDFDKISPWECITKLNEKFGVRTWAAPDGYLYVGARSSTGVHHLTAPDDERVWKLTDYGITPPRDPVVRSVVRGGWTDDPSEGWVEQAGELLNLNRGTKDFRVEAVASREISSFLGQKITYEYPGAKRDVLESLAKQKMMAKQREQQSGYIELLPEFSGSAVSNIRYAAIGDTIQTIPPDDDSDDGSVCDTKIHNETFDVVGVQHELTDDGNWNLRLDVTKKLDGKLDPANIDTQLRYYDPHAKEYIEGDNYDNLSDKEGDGFFAGMELG